MLHRVSITHINPSHFPLPTNTISIEYDTKATQRMEGKSPSTLTLTQKGQKTNQPYLEVTTLPHYAANHHQTEYAKEREKRSTNKSQKWRKILGQSIPIPFIE